MSKIQCHEQEKKKGKGKKKIHTKQGKGDWKWGGCVGEKNNLLLNSMFRRGLTEKVPLKNDWKEGFPWRPSG